MRVGDRVHVRIGGTSDLPILRPGFLLESYENGSTWGVRVLLSPFDHSRYPDVVSRKDAEAGHMWIQTSKRGSGLLEFWGDSDRGEPTWRPRIRSDK